MIKTSKVARKGLTFTQALARFRTAITTRARKNGSISSAELGNVVVSVTGPRRGAIVRRAFESLIEDRVLRKTSETAYNRSTHHSVTVYRTGNTSV